MSARARSGLSAFVHALEENLIALLLGAMTLITFANVIARYVFSANILWALEATVFLFAWLVLIGTSYCIKIGAHLGVDIIIAAMSPGLRRAFGLLAAAACLAFSVLLLIGSWNYWAPFAGLPTFDPQKFAFLPTRNQAWYEVNDIPMPGFMQFIADLMNDGERYEKIPRFIPYFALPLGIALVTFRFLQVGWRIVKGEQDMIIASHEAEEMLEEHRKSGGEA